jgi:hypothetical protein
MLLSSFHVLLNDLSSTLRNSSNFAMMFFEVTSDKSCLLSAIVADESFIVLVEFPKSVLTSKRVDNHEHALECIRKTSNS